MPLLKLLSWSRKSFSSPCSHLSSPLPSSSNWQHLLIYQDSTHIHLLKILIPTQGEMFTSSSAATRNRKLFVIDWSVVWRIFTLLPSTVSRCLFLSHWLWTWPHHLLWQWNMSSCDASGDFKSTAWFGRALVHLSFICHKDISQVASNPRRTNTHEADLNPNHSLDWPRALNRTAPADAWICEQIKKNTAAVRLCEFGGWFVTLHYCTKSWLIYT